MIIQNIIYKNLFNIDQRNFYFEKDGLILTNTYFNIFSPSLWLQQANLNKQTHFYCNLEFQGSGIAYIVAVNSNFQEYDFVKFVITGYKKIKIKLPSFYLYYYVKWESSLVLINGNYECNIKSIQKKMIKLCLVTVTFKRNIDIKNLIQTYLLLKDMYKLVNLDLIIVNNDNEPLISNEKIKGITEILSKNTGGSGGFIRGMKLAISRNKYTNILLCDDDIILHPETIYRTFSFLKLSNDKNIIISGTMFESNKQTFCHCILESLNKRGHHRNILGRINIEDPFQLRLIINDMINKIDEIFINQYAAWWYCCIPIELIYKFGYPLQLFMRGDDQEYGIRLKSKIIAINGIQVWHPAFSSKHSILRDYLGNRNYAIINIIHYKKYLNNIFFHFIIKFFRSVNKKDSISASILALALQDCLTFNNKEIELDIILKRIEIIKKRNLFASFISIVKSLLILFVKGSKIKARLKSFISSEH